MSGRLATVDDRPLANQPVRILVDGTTVSTFKTDETGGYETTICTPATVDGTAEVTAVYDGAGTNVADTEATDTVSGLPIVQTLLDELWWPGLLIAGLGLLLAIWAYQQRGQGRDDPGSPDIVRDSLEGDEPTRPERVPAPVLLELTRERLNEGDPNRAIGLAYVAVRSHFRATDVPGWTHWEFDNETRYRWMSRPGE